MESASDARAAVRALAVELHDAKPIVATIVEIRGDKVRTGYAAPEDGPLAVAIHRLEVWEAIQRGITVQESKEALLRKDGDE